MVCLDTDILVALLKGHEKATQTIARLQNAEEPVSTTVITAYELMKGALASSKPVENLKTINDLLQSLTVMVLDHGACLESSRIYSQLRRHGKIVGEFDILIAGIVKHNKETLITRDKPFQEIEGLKLLTW